MADLDAWGIDPEIAKAMTHPLRVEILIALGDPGALVSPSQFSEQKLRPLSNVAYHFRCLEKADLIEVIKEEKVRGSVRHTYRAKKRALFTNSKAWEGLPGQARSSVAATAWAGYVDAAGRAIAAGAFERRADSNFSWAKMRVDEIGWVDMQAAFAALLQKMFAVEDESAERIEASEDEEGFDVTYGLGAFEMPPPAEPKTDESASEDEEA